MGAAGPARHTDGRQIIDCSTERGTCCNEALCRGPTRSLVQGILLFSADR